MPENVTARRGFLFNTAKLAGALTGGGLIPPSIARAYSIAAQGTSRTIKDVQHIVILMQENRSFDHYLGSLRGVRGFGDPRPLVLSSGYPVWYQPSSSSFVLPFRPTPPAGSKQANTDIYYDGLAHDWDSTHNAWNNGRYDSWAKWKSPVLLASRSGNPQLGVGVYTVWYLFDDGYQPLYGPLRLNL